MNAKSALSGTEVLDLPMQENDSKASTVRDYLKALLEELWQHGEGFSGKRPFGNSSWEYDLYEALGRAGLIHVTFDDDYLDEIDVEKANLLIRDAIKSLH